MSGMSKDFRREQLGSPEGALTTRTLHQSAASLLGKSCHAIILDYSLLEMWWDPMIALRPYQFDAVERVREQLRAGSRRVLIVAPTGSGKTVLAAHIMACAVESGRRVLFVAHRRELIEIIIVRRLVE